MKDLEKLLRSSLKQVGGEYQPTDPVAARERFLAVRRRRRFLAVGEFALAAGMAVLAVVFISRANLGSEQTIELATEQPRVVATIDTETSPVAVAVGEGAVWMTDADGGGIRKLDPATNAEIATIAPPGMGQPDEVLVGAGSVWVSNNDGQVFRIDPQTGSFEATPHLVPGDQVVHLDLALTDDHLWALDPATSTLTKISVSSASDGDFVGTSGGFNDIATDGGEVWGYNAEAGRIAPAEGTGDGFPAPKGDANSDLAVGFGAAWVATGAEGAIHRIDLASGEETRRIDIGGDYADLTVSVDDDAVWALAIDRDRNVSTLYEIDPASGEMVGVPLELEGQAADISAGEGSLWVPDVNGKVFKIAPEAGAAPSPQPTESAVTELPEDRLLYVFVRDGDLWARYPATEERLTTTPEVESAPAVNLDGTSVAFVRRPTEDGPPAVVELDVAGGEESLVAEGGTEPAYGPNGELAWVVQAGANLPSNEAVAAEPYISFRTGDEAPQSFPVFAPGVYIPGLGIQELAWDGTGTMLFIETLYEGRSVQTIDVEVDEDGKVQLSPAEVITPHDYGKGGAYQAPSGPIAPLVVHSCCVRTEGDVATGFDLGIATTTAEGTRYERIVDLDLLNIEEGMKLRTAYLGEIGVNVEGRFVTSLVPSYLLLVGETVWVVDGDGDLVPFESSVSDMAAPFTSN